MNDILRIVLMANIIAYWVTWFVASISHVILTTACHSAVTRDTMLQCIAAMPLWFGWFWRVIYGWV